MDYKLSKKDGGPIDKDKAKKWMKRYADQHKDGVKAYFYGTDLIQKILSHRDAVGMRIYFSYDENDKLKLVLIGSREDGSNIWPSEISGKDGDPDEDEGGTIGNDGVSCPPFCPKE